MTLGEKIKNARCELKLTQSALCGDKITRNMLSEIERGKAAPSLDTLRYLASALRLPIEYFLSDDDSLFQVKKKAAIGKIRAHLADKKYKAVIELTESLGESDDETNYILALAHFELGRAYVSGGSLLSGQKHLEIAIQKAAQTVYDTERIEHLALIYSAISKNVKAPLLELDIKKFENNLFKGFDYDLFNYISSAEECKYKNPLYAKHARAKALMKQRKYKEAILILKEIELEKTPATFNAYAILSVYCDIEICSKELADFEQAYKYASKQLTLLEAFKS